MLPLGRGQKRIHAFYRAAVWLPLAVPLMMVGLRGSLGDGPVLAQARSLMGLAMASLVYGGIPYAAFAIWATWRIGRLSEPQIKRWMLFAPPVMVGMFTAFLFLAGLRVGRPEFGLLGPLGAVFIIPLGYAYVTVVYALRQLLDRRPGWIVGSQFPRRPVDD